MSNQDLMLEVKALIEEVARTHRYSISRIYGLYNRAFAKSETPQSCASCLIRKVNELKAWLAAQPGVELGATEEKEVSTPKKAVRKQKQKK